MNNNADDYQKALKEMAKDNPNIEKVINLLENSSQDGDSRATYALGTWYLYGTHFKKDIRKAIKLLRQAAKDNEPNAIYDLAVCYENGEGVKKNLKLAMEHYMRASLYGDKQSIYEVGRCYYYGIGIDKNKRLAWIWLDYAKKLGLEERPTSQFEDSVK